MALLSVKRLGVIVLLFLLLGLSACSETKGADTPQILGVPPKTSFVDVFYEYTFGADGGDNILQYRLVQAPFWLNIESLNGAKPKFRIYGVPQLEPGDNFEQFEGADYEVIIEVSDGVRASQETFSIEMLTNFQYVVSTKILPEEGSISEPIEDDSPEFTCTIPDLTPYELGGRTVYPFAVQVFLQYLAESKVVIPYTLSSSYIDSLGERDDRNVKNARPDVDFVDNSGVVSFEPGEARCFAVLGVYDDPIVEADEVLNIEFEDATAGFVKLKDPLVNVTIVDDEPDVSWNSASSIESEGASKTFTLTLSEAVDFPISINVFAEDSKSTIDPADYSITPSTVVIDANDLSADVVINIEADGDVGGDGADEFLSVRNDVSTIFSLESIEITINDWSSTVTVADSGVSTVANSASINSIDNVVVLSTVSAADDDASISIYNRNGVLSGFTTAPVDAIIASVDGGDEVGTSIEAVKWSNRNDVVVTSTTTGNVAGPNNGMRDIAVRLYSGTGTNQTHTIAWTRQLGTVSDDLSVGATIDPSGNVYVYGATGGSFDGGVPNKGEVDAFVAKYSAAGDLQWTKMIGTAGSDIATGIAFSKSRVHVTGTTTGSLEGVNEGDKDGFITSFDVNGEFIRQTQFGTAFEDVVSSMVNVDDQLILASHSRGDLTGSGASKNSVDAFALNIDLQLAQDSAEVFGDDLLDDELKGASSFDDYAVVAGSTLGVVGGQTSAGGRDAFLVGMLVDAPKVGVEWYAQYGTAKNDQAIDISNNKGKVMLLWETDEGANTVYKLSPFDGNSGGRLVSP